MSKVNYWKQFENTGKVEDYISYRGGCDRDVLQNAGAVPLQRSAAEICVSEGTAIRTAGSESLCRKSYV